MREERKKTETKTGAPAKDHWCASALKIGLNPKIFSVNEKGIDLKDVKCKMDYYIVMVP